MLIHLKHFAPEAPAFLFSPIKVDRSCEHSDTLGGESAAEAFMITIRRDVLVTNQLTTGRSERVHFFVGEALLLNIIFQAKSALMC